MSPALKSTLSWIVSLLIPYTLLMLGAHLLLSPLFLQIEYNLPGFPPDPYGFTTEDRIRWGTPSLVYLLNDQGISYLADLKFDKPVAPIYNDRELSHMRDVKSVLQILLNIWYGALTVLIVFAVWARRADWLEAYIAGWRRGGFLMIALLIGFGAFAVTSFWDFFTWFHSLFFAGDTWQFFYSDTLIRLFPMRFWQDCFIYIGSFCVIVALILIFGLKPKVDPA